MQITVLGAGAMGALFGGKLAACKQPHRVTLLDTHQAQLDAINQHGLLLETEQGRQRIKVHACLPSAATQVPDVLLVFTKTMHTQAALLSVRHLLRPHTLVLSLQNGLGNGQTLTQALAGVVAQSHILVGTTTLPSDLVSPGHVRSHGSGQTRFTSFASFTAITPAPIVAPTPGMPPIANHQEDQASVYPAAAIEALVNALNQAGLACTLDPHALCAIWEKVAFNAALNSMCALTGCTVGQLNQLAEGRALALAVVAEVAGVAQAHNIAFDQARVEATLLYALANHSQHKPSMLQDIQAQRPTEIEAIAGSVVQAARSHGLAVPQLSTLYVLVRLLENRNH